MISDEEAAKIRQKLDEGWRGPVLLTWLLRRLDDREERVRRERPSEPQVYPIGQNSAISARTSRLALVNSKDARQLRSTPFEGSTLDNPNSPA